MIIYSASHNTRKRFSYRLINNKLISRIIFYKAKAS
jgi:hypothetical protein